ncbi:CAP domain-containing protein [Streptomyces pristinaespiralis]|nr:CAP domain-containing protein [Streptomyces pristinaespiralis]ALC25305.1 RNA polymerase ECF-subfamily sigma factor [Streptomyces pristinaespiralis]QMU12467.1 CAP domain-containing protein [Streptomyces pristinaespiralis]
MDPGPQAGRPRLFRVVLALAAGTVLLAAVAVAAFMVSAGTGTTDTEATPAPGDAVDGPTDTAAPLPPAAGRALVSRTARITALVNAERDKAGCPRLAVDARLESAARAHADDMAARGYYGHVGPDGRDGGKRMTAAGYTWSRWAENIHRGRVDPSAVVADWLRSPEHRESILDCRFEDMGVGVNTGPGGPWWVQDLGTRRGAR